MLPKVFANANPGTTLNFRDILLPQLRVNGRVSYLCGAAHVKGMDCTRASCRFLHLPPNGPAALDDVGKERINLCVRQNKAIRWASA